MKQIYIIAGANGSGKTTSAKILLPKFLSINEFVNADEIAKGLSPFNPDSVQLQAGKLMLERMDNFIKHGKSFAYETTLASKIFLKILRKARQNGYKITLLFLWVDSYDISKKRVNIRVKQGGHNIPQDTIERRYKRGLKNLNEYLNLVDEGYIYNANNTPNLHLIARKEDDSMVVFNQDIWLKISEAMK